MAPIKAVLLDIEGTTTPISFVANKLFPYARQHMLEFVRNHWSDDALQEVIAQANRERSGKQDLTSAELLHNYMVDLMDGDAKATSLKSLQGMIWKAGYENGELKGEIFADVCPSLRRWHLQGTSIYIYSSGSVPAQRLLFGYSQEGDLNAFIKGNFDTKTGQKIARESYTQIAAEIGLPPESVLFVTDVVKEAAAATAAGMQVRVSVRKGNAPLSSEDACQWTTITNFDELFVDEGLLWIS